MVSIPSNYTVNNTTYSVTLSGSAVSVIIPAFTIKSNQSGAWVLVESMNSNEISGSGVYPGSFFVVMNMALGTVTTMN